MPERDSRPEHCNEDDLFVMVYEQLRALAYQKMAHENPGHTLQPTALVHEAYLRLARDADVHWENRRHFCAAAAEAMQRILIEWARRKETLKRGRKWKRVGMGQATVESNGCTADIIDVGDALKEFEAVDPRACEVIRLRYLVGLDSPEIAEILEVSRRTVYTDLVVGKAWLRNQVLSRPSPKLPTGPEL